MGAMKGKFSKEDLIRIKNTPSEELAVEERRMKNLHIHEKGQFGAQTDPEKAEKVRQKAQVASNKKRKELKDWSTKVRELLNDEEFAKSVFKDGKFPVYADSLDNKTAGELIPAIMLVRAMKGDIRAAEFLRKLGYGDKVDVNVNTEGFFDKTTIVFEVAPTTKEE